MTTSTKNGRWPKKKKMEDDLKRKEKKEYNLKKRKKEDALKKNEIQTNQPKST